MSTSTAAERQRRLRAIEDARRSSELEGSRSTDAEALRAAENDLLEFRLAQLDLLRAVPEDELPEQVAYLYDYLNFAHPFREGNGRAQREFFAQLLAESGTPASVTSSGGA